MKRYSLLINLKRFHELEKVPARESPNLNLLLGSVPIGMARLNLNGTLYEIRHFNCPIWLPTTEVVHL